MGAYLSSPIRSKESECGGNEKLSYGASAMQGWRMQQEDAHNCIVSFDEDCSLFAVYDGHGGHEVSQYAAKKFPEFLKNLEMWSNGRYGQALEDAFLKFDELLIDSNVVQELETIAGLERDKKEDEDDEDKAKLFEEANLPLEEVLSRYGITVRYSNGVEGNEENGDQIDLGEKKRPPTRKLKIPLKKRKFLKKSAENSENDDVETSENAEHSAEIVENPEFAVETMEKFEMVVAERTKSASSKIEKMMQNFNAEVFKQQKTALKIRGGVKRASDGQAKEKSSAEDEKTALNIQEDGPFPKRDKKISTENLGENSENLLEINGSCENDAGNLAADGAPSVVEVGADVAKKSEMTSPNSGEKMTNGKNEGDESGQVCEEGVRMESCTVEKDESKNATCERVEKKHNDDVSSLKNGENETTENVPMKESKEGENEEDEEDDEEYAGEEEDKDDSSAEDEDSEESGEEQSDGEDEESEEDEMMDEEGLELDEAFPVPPTDTPGVSSGTTACVALVKGESLYVANAGDSRCVLCRAGRAVDLSDDHKPEDPNEQARIENAGGRISDDGRVNGGLNLSRALGDHFYKTTANLPLKDQMITALPDVRVEKLLPEDRFLVLACDGIWNSMSSQSVVDFVNSRLDKDMDPVKICEEMCDGCLAESTAGDGTGCDNMTVIIVNLKKPHKCNKIDDSEQVGQSQTNTKDQGQPGEENQPGKNDAVSVVDSTEQNQEQMESVPPASQ